MLRSKKVRLGAGLALGLLVLAGIWVGWQVWRVERDLSAAVRDANAVKAAVRANDQPELDRQLKALESDSARASRRTSGATWGVLSHIPFFGDDARGIRTTSQVIADLARDGVAPLAQVHGELDSLLPKRGAIDLAAIGRLQAPVAQAQTAFATADRRLSALDPSGYVSALRSKLDTFRGQVSEADRAMTSARAATTMLPTMLGQHGPQNYLLVFQNNAEIRATGGLPGAVAEIHADHGKLSIMRQVSGAQLGRAARSPLPLTTPEKQLYGDVFGQFFLDANFTPDVPRAADLMRARWQQVYPQDNLGGVVLIDTVSLGYILDATGPVDVDGIHLTGANVVDELLSRAYARLSGKQQDAFFAHVAKAAFERFTTGVSNGPGVVSALAKASGEGRVYVHSFDPALQARIAGTEVAGDLLSNPAKDRPQVAITLNDTTGSKMSYYLRYQVDASATYCTGGVQGLTLKAHLQSTAPIGAGRSLPAYVTGSGDVIRGDDLVTLRVFGPVGGSIGQLMWNDKPMSLIRATQDGRPVAMTYIELKPGQTVDLTLTMRSGQGQTGDTDVAVTPTIQRSDAMPSLPSACR